MAPGETLQGSQHPGAGLAARPQLGSQLVSWAHPHRGHGDHVAGGGEQPEELEGKEWEDCQKEKQPGLGRPDTSSTGQAGGL